MKRPVLVFFLWVLILLPGQASAQDPTTLARDLFEKGNTAYAEERWPDAVAAYESILNRGLQSAPLYFNLANAYAREEQFGRAILYYHRALWLDPFNDIYRLHLQEVRDRAFSRGSNPGIVDLLSARLSLDQWTLLAVLAFWTGVGLLILPPLLGRRRFYLLSGNLLLLATLSGWAAFERLQDRRDGIIVSAEAVLKVAPTRASPLRGNLAEGIRCRIQRQEREHFYITTPDGNAGWVPRSDFIPIVPQAGKPSNPQPAETTVPLSIPRPSDPKPGPSSSQS